MDRSARSRVLRIEAPDGAERAALDALVLRSKAHWGYDGAMMEIMARWLATEPAAYDQDRIRVARRDGQTAGVAQISQVQDGACELELLFIDPAFMGSGAGRALYDWAIKAARDRGASRLVILSDPYARPFYEAMGADFIEDRPSAAVPGRTLPVLSHAI